MDFNDFEWHDSIIESITIDRKEPGIKDEILLNIQWVNGKRSLIKFIDVYKAILDMNFGVIAQESIFAARILDNDDQDLIRFYSNWKGLMDDVKLSPYLIELNSTGSQIKILAKNIEIIDF